MQRRIGIGPTYLALTPAGVSHPVSTHTNHPTEKPKHPEFPFHARWLLVGLPTSILFTLPVNLSFGTKKNNPQTPNMNQPAEMQPLVETPSVTENVVYDYYYYIINGGSSSQMESGGSSTETTVPIPTQTTTSTTTTGSSTGSITQSSSSNTTPNMYRYIYHGPVTPISSPIINSPISSPGSPISSSPQPIINLPPVITSPPSSTQPSSGSTPPTTIITPVGVERTPFVLPPYHPSIENIITPITTITKSGGSRPVITSPPTQTTTSNQTFGGSTTYIPPFVSPPYQPPFGIRLFNRPSIYVPQESEYMGSESGSSSITNPPETPVFTPSITRTVSTGAIVPKEPPILHEGFRALIML